MTIIFTILIASFLINEYFGMHSLDQAYVYKNRFYFRTSYIISIVVWVLLIVSSICEFSVVKYVSLIILSILLIKEVIVMIIKLMYYNKLIKEKSVNKKIKNEMAMDSLKNIFVLLSSPFLVIKTIFNFLLNKIFKEDN